MEARGRPFAFDVPGSCFSIAAVVIDQTSEGDGGCPNGFAKCSGLAYPAGKPPPAFVARILRLLEQESPAASASTAPPMFAAPPPPASPIPAPAAAPAAIKRRTPLVWIGIMAVLLCVGIAAWATRSTWLRPPTVVAYSNEDRGVTFALLPFHAPADDAHALQIAKATGDEILTLLESRKELVSVAPRGGVEQAVAREVSMKKLAKALDVHFLIRGTVARGADNYTVTVLGIDGDSERVLSTQSLTVALNALTPRWRNDVQEAVFQVVWPSLSAEVKRARDKPVDALDVRDLSFRAAVDWRAHRDTDGKAANANANELLNRALVLAPDDQYALRQVAIINLCDCVNAWSSNPDEQKAIECGGHGEVPAHRSPPPPPCSGEKASLYQLRGHWEESLVIADSLLQHDPEDANALDLKAAGLLRLGRLKEAQAIADGLTARCPTDWYEHHRIVRRHLLCARRLCARGPAGAQGRGANERARATRSGRRHGAAHADRRGSPALDTTHEPRLRSADFTATLPNVTTITAMKKWVHPSADLADFEPLYDGLRLAGVSD